MNADVPIPIIVLAQQVAEPLRCTLEVDFSVSEKELIAGLRAIYRDVRGKVHADSDWRYFEGVHLHRKEGLSYPEAANRLFGSVRQADQIRDRDAWAGDRDYLIDFYRKKAKP